MSYRQTLRAQLDALNLDKREAEQLERALSKAAIVALMAEGFTVAMAANALGIPESTPRTWARSDQDFATAMDVARDHTRGWLLGQCRRIIESDGRAAGQAINVVANLLFPELRSSKVDVHSTGAPDPERSAANLAALLERGDS